MVFVQNAEVKEAKTAEELLTLFNDGSSNRHVASTKMNSESSRSHLIISVVIETCNKITDAVLRGKVRNVRYGTLYSRSTQSITDGTTCHNFYHYQSVIHFFKLTKYCTQI